MAMAFGFYGIRFLWLLDISLPRHSLNLRSKF